MTERPAPELSIIVPAFNEGAALLAVITEMFDALATTGASMEIVLVDDGSEDNTVDLLSSLATAFGERLIIVRHKTNLGLGIALTKGLSVARGKWVGTLPGDGQFDPADMAAMFAMRDCADAVIGQVVQSGKAHRHAVLRRVASWIIRTAIRIIHPTAPCLSGVFLIRRKMADADHLVCRSPFAHTEIVDRIRRAGGKLTYARNTVRPRRAGFSKTANAATAGEILWDLVRLRIAYLSS